MAPTDDDVAALVEEVRAACGDLARHPALRRDGEAARLEADVRAAQAGAALDGARVPLDRVRELAAGASAQGAAEGVALAGLRVRSAALRGWHGPGTRVPAVPLGQLVVGLHVAGGGDGRLRFAGEPQDLRGLGAAPSGPVLGAALVRLADRVGDAVRGSEPGLVVAAGALAELSLLRPFSAGNAAVARAVFRRLLVVTGLDPTGLVVPEVAWVSAPQAHLAALAAATADGWEAWLRHCGEAVLAGAAEGRAVADAVASGRLGGPWRSEGAAP
ncbi:MAG: hypothetical protein KQH57_00020 [Actinomycetales bacterium]|nr:hypothetical protein [Actinomycetales bacterium]